MSIGSNVKRRREQLGLKQVDVAARAGITQAMLCQIERGRKNPSLSVANDLAQVLECRMEDFLKDDSGNNLSARSEDNTLSLRRAGDTGTANRQV